MSKDFATIKDAELIEFCRDELARVTKEGTKLARQSQALFESAWITGGLLIELKNRLASSEKWEAFAKATINPRYWRIYRAMRLARIDSTKPPMQGALGFKQLLILLELERVPKHTPRKQDGGSTRAFRAGVHSTRRWWQGGKIAHELTDEQRKQLAVESRELAALAATIAETLGSENEEPGAANRLTIRTTTPGHGQGLPCHRRDKSPA